MIVFFHTAQIQFQSDCAYSKFIASLLTINAVIFTYMFSSFYYHNYIAVKTNAKKNDDLSASNGQVKINGNLELSAESKLNNIKSSWYEQPSQVDNTTTQRLVNGSVRSK
jgi:hypothetical protein